MHDRDGARGRSRAPAAALHRHAAQGADPGRRRHRHPRHFTPQPGGCGADRRRGGRGLCGGRGDPASRSAGGSARRTAQVGVQRQGRDLEQRLLDVGGARAHGGRCIAVNGDTVHPPTVEEALLAARGPEILLAVDQEKKLGEEEMKVLLDADGNLAKITKLMDPASAHGEYIGASLIEPSAVPALAAALQVTFERDPNLYYEDGYQTFVDHGGRIGTAPIPVGTSWVEVDDPRDLARAREIACLY